MWDWWRERGCAHARLNSLGENLFLVNFPSEVSKWGGKNQWMLFSQRHKKKAVHILYPPRRTPRPSGNHFSRESNAVFCALKWWVAPKVHLRPCCANSRGSNVQFATGFPSEDLLSMHNKCAHLIREAFDFFMAFLVFTRLMGAYMCLAPPPPRASRDCSGLCSSNKQLLIYFRRKHRWPDIDSLGGGFSANILLSYKNALYILMVHQL